MKNLSKIASLAAIALLLMVSPVMADTDIEVSGNGANSKNSVTISSNNQTEVEQANEANVENKVSLTSNTGGNSTNGNTGGNNSIKTGDTVIGVAIETVVNSNEAKVAGCCDSGSSTDIDIKDNGKGSKNEVKEKKTKKLELSQDNEADIENDVEVEVTSGKNQAKKNTKGKNKITTGAIEVGVGITTIGNSNKAVIKGCGCENGGGLDVEIADNGKKSKNGVKVEVKTESDHEQDNEADVENEVAGELESGDNKANGNTKGKNKVTTGAVTALVSLFNQLNLNVLRIR